jgi:N-acyl homoserine lactone hydrolase
MEIARLYLGSISGPQGPATPFNGFLIKHPKGPVMVDTGFGLVFGSAGPTGELVFGDQRFPWVRRKTTDALADHGLEPGDIKYIVNTHLGDHSGDNHMFREATFIIQQPEAEWHRSGGMPYFGTGEDKWDFPGAKIELLEAEDVEILPGVRALFTPGHTPGHQSVMVQDEGVKSLFTGDAAYTLDIWEDPDQMREGHPSFQLQVHEGSLEIWRESVAKLAALEPDDVYFAHDANIVHGAHRHR